MKNKVGRPTKLYNWIDAFKIIVNENNNAIICTDDELRLLTNEIVDNQYRITSRTFENWKVCCDDTGIRKDFLNIYKLALIEQKRNLFNKLIEDTNKWQRWAWIIERKFKEWNIKTNDKQSVSVLSPYQNTNLTYEELLK